MTEAIVPRWEWRVFAERFGAAERRLGSLATAPARVSDERYVLLRSRRGAILVSDKLKNRASDQVLDASSSKETCKLLVSIDDETATVNHHPFKGCVRKLPEAGLIVPGGPGRAKMLVLYELQAPQSSATRHKNKHRQGGRCKKRERRTIPSGALLTNVQQNKDEAGKRKHRVHPART